MLEQVLAHLSNWFVVPNGVHFGKYEIKGGGVALPFLVDGQYFRVMGSVLNDGLYEYPATGMTDETFDGAIWALAIPPALISISEEMEKWQEKNGATSAGPYQSESFGGYSYTRATGANGGAATVFDAYAAQLSPYKKARETAFVQPSQPLKFCGLHPPNPWR